MKKPHYVLAGICSLALLATAATVQFPSSEKVFESHFIETTYPAGATSQDLEDALVSWSSGNGLPAGWAVTESRGKVTGTTTGLVDPVSGYVHLIVTIVDESDDIGTATVSLNSQVLVTGTRQNGMIVDRSGKGVATLSTWVPPGPGSAVSTEWISVDLATTYNVEVQR